MIRCPAASRSRTATVSASSVESCQAMTKWSSVTKADPEAECFSDYSVAWALRHAAGDAFASLSLDAQEALWIAAKQRESGEIA